MRYFSTFTGIGGFELGIHNAYREAYRRSKRNKAANDEKGQGLVATQGQTVSPQDGRASTGATDIADKRPLRTDVPPATWGKEPGIRIEERGSYIEHESMAAQQPACVGYSEIDKYAIQVFERNNPGIRNYGDITKINAKDLPDFDCLVGGFPCQAFSIAGLRRGFEDTRGTLFFDLSRILREKQPRYCVFENVKGLLSHDEGRTFYTIISTLDELGYDCQWQVLNSKDFGVPQNRERVVIVGHLRGTPRPQVFPIGEGDTSLNGYGGQGLRIQRGEISNAIDANYFKGHDGKRQLIDDGVKIRRLTPLECERLQGFPDDWTKYGEDEYGVRVPMSDTQRYKMCGNAVTTNVIQAVFERIFA